MANSRATDLGDAIARALHARSALIDRLRAEGTDCYRIFHGISEGRPGLTVDRYADLVLVQTFREPLVESELQAIERAVGSSVVWNHRGKGARASFADFHDAGDDGAREHVVRELGVAYSIRARHRGLDPWLFLDLRAGRRALTEVCAGKSVLNLFAYTGTAGIAALVHGAREAWNVDFARSSLDVALRNAELNAIPAERLVEIQEDVFPIVWQLSGSPVKGRASSRAYVRVDPRRFDAVFLDPPASSKGPFGSVDVERDYPSMFKPALLALEENGTLIATNHVAAVDAQAWRDTLLRCAAKAGRPLREIVLLGPDDDFPAFDGRKPLKIAVCRL
jgi:23S rRNA (cytosine1962-C5)-methyltransferase